MASGKKRAAPLTFDYIRRPLEELLQCLESGDVPSEARRATNLAFWIKLRAILGAGQLSSGLKYLDDVALALLNDNEEGAAELFSGVVTLVPPPEHQRGGNRPADDAAFHELRRPASGDQGATVARPSRKPKSAAASAAQLAAKEAPSVEQNKPEQAQEEKGAETVDVDVDAAHPTTRKRRTPSPRAVKQPMDKQKGEDAEAEKQPKQKRAKTTKGANPKPGRQKKAVVEPEEDETQRQMEQKVAALSDDIKGRFGQIVWAKMGGYPYWPCIILDPRLLPRKQQEAAMKVLETKFLVFFYVSNNMCVAEVVDTARGVLSHVGIVVTLRSAPIMFKWIESWDDTKANYRDGHPEKDSKAPKRRVKLLEAIDLADVRASGCAWRWTLGGANGCGLLCWCYLLQEEIKLPIEERAGGLLKP
jgi:hypothetical protein